MTKHYVPSCSRPWQQLTHDGSLGLGLGKEEVQGYEEIHRPGTYIYREDEEVKRALYNIQWRYGKDESGKNRLRVLRVAESDVDLLKEIELINQREGMQASEGKNLSTTLSEDEIKIQIARRVYEALPDIGVE